MLTMAAYAYALACLFSGSLAHGSGGAGTGSNTTAAEPLMAVCSGVATVPAVQVGLFCSYVQGHNRETCDHLLVSRLLWSRARDVRRAVAVRAIQCLWLTPLRPILSTPSG